MLYTPTVRHLLTKMTDEQPKWNAETSETFRQVAAIAVPHRSEQIAALLTLIPFGSGEAPRVVELASGEGRLADAILHVFPQASLLALDIEETMRDQTTLRLRPYGERAAVAAFDMAAADWYDHLKGADVVVSSLCVHHLNGAEKQVLFQAVHDRLSPRGALLIADLIMPSHGAARGLFAATWEKTAEAASLAQSKSRSIYERFLAICWNYFRYPDPFDQPSPLADQLVWLREAGFAVADCFWMQAGHAIYGGYMTADENGGIDYDTALAAARLALE
jgi:tRNA (cmo5U34)-methyltransferase